MADILSQEEVDALLSAVSSGEIPVNTTADPGIKKQVNVYDFKRPEMISKDQVRTLQMVHENFARFLSNFMSTYLRTVVEINLIAVDQLTYGEFIMSLPNPTSINIMSMDPLMGRGIFEVNPILVFTIVDRLLGGPGISPQEIRLFTDIEQKIMSNVVQRALVGLSEAWEHVADIDFKFVDKEMNPQFCQILAPSETVAAITLEVKIAETKGIMSICIPYLSLEPLIDKLSAQHLIGAPPKKISDDQKRNIEFSLKNASVTVTFEVGRTQLPIRDIMELQAGDIIMFEKSVNTPNYVFVENVPKFYGVPGLIGSKKGFLISSRIDY